MQGRFELGLSGQRRGSLGCRRPVPQEPGHRDQHHGTETPGRVLTGQRGAAPAAVRVVAGRHRHLRRERPVHRLQSGRGRHVWCPRQTDIAGPDPRGLVSGSPGGWPSHAGGVRAGRRTTGPARQPVLRVAEPARGRDAVSDGSVPEPGGVSRGADHPGRHSRHFPPQGARSPIGAGQRGRRSRRPGQEHVPGQYVPRDPHPAERHPGLRGSPAGRTRSCARAAPALDHHPAQRQPPAGDHQRCPGVGARRVRPRTAQPRPVQSVWDAGRRPADVQPARPGAGAGVPGGFAGRPAAVGRGGRDQAAASDHQPVGQRLQVHSARRHGCAASPSDGGAPGHAAVGRGSRGQRPGDRPGGLVTPV